MPVKVLDDKKTLLEAGKEGNAVFALFSATWCPACQMFEPVFLEVGSKKDFPMFKVDVEQHEELAGAAGVQGIPNLVVFKEGKVVDRLVGFVSPEDLEKFLAKHS